VGQERDALLGWLEKAMQPFVHKKPNLDERMLTTQFSIL
jgi:hypothetical protein